MQSITLDQLIALNRELQALTAAGVPLESGLRRVAEEFSGPSSQLAERLAKRMESGLDLAAAIDAEGQELPAAFRAVVRAGLKSGRLTAALEGYGQTAARMAELRRVAGLATIYPVLLLVTMWILFSFVVRGVLPNFDWLGINDRLWVQPLRLPLLTPTTTVGWIVWALVPLGLIFAGLVWWWRSAVASGAILTGGAGWLGWVPGISQVRRLGTAATFAQLLRLLIGQQIPLGTALPLAAEGSGLALDSEQLQKLVDHVQSGQRLTTRSPEFADLPPLVRLALLRNRGPEALASGLVRAAETYQERAEQWAQRVGLYLPIALSLAVGGTLVAGYALLLLQPYIETLKEVSTWN